MATQSDIGELTVLGQRSSSSEMPFLAVAVRWGVGLIGLGLLGWMLYLHPHINFRYVFLFAAAMLAAEVLLTVRVAPGSYFSIASTFLFVYFLLGGGVAAAALDAGTRLVVWLIQYGRKRTVQTPLYAFFNIGQFVISTLAGALIVQLFFEVPAVTSPVFLRAVPSLIVFALSYLLCNSILTTIAVMSRAGFHEVLTQLWPTSTVWAVISVLTSIPFAVVIILLSPSIGFIYATIFVLFLLAGISQILRLNVDLKDGNNDLKAINRIGTLLSATLDLPELFRIIAMESRRVLHADGFFLAIGEKDSEEVSIIFLTSAGEEIAQRKIARGAGLTGKAMTSGELIHYERGERDGADDPEDTMRGNKRPRSIVVAPMKFGQEIIGAISVQSFQPDVYGPSQFRLLHTIAGQAASAIRNAQLFQSEERARVERDEFLSLVTHEIKNPLTSIRGYADLAEEAAKSKDMEEVLDSVNVIRTEAGRILRLAEDLLDASKMAGGRFSVRMDLVDFAALVQQIVDRYAATADREILLKVDQPVPSIRGDSVRLSQVIENLVSNALKYSLEGAPIDLRLRHDGRYVYLSIADRGEGIPPSKLPLIFERFYRIEDGEQVVKGTGLGLFISREIARMHAGTIRVESIVGQGSTFTVELPIGGREEAV